MISKPTPLTKRGSASKDEIAAHILHRFKDLKRRREKVESKWDTTYMMYRANPDDMTALKRASFTTGSKRDWNHRVNTGKTFEVVETLVAYLKGATFPSDDWFNAEGLEPNLAQAAALVKHLAKFKMEEALIRDVYEEWLRNLVIFGCSTFEVHWESSVKQQTTRVFDPEGNYEDNTKNVDVEKLCIEALSPYDVWIDGHDTTFVRLQLTKEELAYHCEEGYYTMSPELLEVFEEGFRVREEGGKQPELIEFYGPVILGGTRYQCVHAVFYANTLVRLADASCWCGSPYITGTMLPDRDSVYGMTVLDPSMGALHILNVLCNARLDNIAVSIDKMFTMVEDGILNKEDVYTEPGKVFTVAQHDSLRPMDMGPPTFTLGYQEAQVQEGSVDRNCSTGPLIGGGQPRGGERVTAQEIVAVQESGGNRLAAVHAHIEDSVTTKLLSKVFSLMQQYVLTTETIRVFMPEADTYAFFELDPSYLVYPYSFKPTGAAYIVEKQRQIGDLMTLFDIAGRVPQLADKIDFERVLLEVLKQMRFLNPTSYIKAASTPVPTPTPEAPAEPALDSLGGAALQRSVMEDGGASLLQGVGIDTSAIDPAQLQAMTQGVLNGGQQDIGGIRIDPGTGDPSGLPSTGTEQPLPTGPDAGIDPTGLPTF